MTDNNQAYFNFKAEIIQGGFAKYETFYSIQATTNKFSFFVDKETKLGLYFEIMEGY